MEWILIGVFVAVDNTQPLIERFETKHVCEQAREILEKRQSGLLSGSRCIKIRKNTNEL